MRPLSASDVLDVCERARGQSLVERALTILAAACPDDDADGLATLSLGARNTRLLAIRDQMFGSTLEACVACPQCRERLELAIDPSALPTPTAPDELFVATADVAVRFRLPNSGDLAAASSCASSAEAHALLVERCVQEALRGGAAVSCRELPDDVLAQLSARMEAADPIADISLELTCPVCTASWTGVLDVAAFLWGELQVEAKRLLWQVHMLARAYGWSERDILALSGARRAHYVEMVA